MARLTSIWGWVGPSALGDLCHRLPGALPQAGIKTRLWRSTVQGSDRHDYCIVGNASIYTLSIGNALIYAPSIGTSTYTNAATAQTIPAWGNNRKSTRLNSSHSQISY